MPDSNRRCAGTVLILVAGISALMASLALSFLVRMRSDAEESDRVVCATQAHLMLTAACNYIQEAARLGWDDPAPGAGVPAAAARKHKEAFGWIDVRDGATGPRDQDRDIPFGVRGSWVDLTLAANRRAAVRQPMFVMRRPPFAILPRAAPNPIATSGANLGLPLVTNPDPQPAGDPLTDWAAYATGDPRPLSSGQLGSWFRVFRDGPATFVVTCGAGGTQGFRSYAEAVALGESTVFADDPELFANLRDQETLLWYRVEWSANVASSDYQNLQNEYSNIDHYVQWPHNCSQSSRSQPHPANMVGTIRWVQRLGAEPDHW